MWTIDTRFLLCNENISGFLYFEQATPVTDGLLLEIPDTVVVELLGFTGYSGVVNLLNSQR